MTIRSYKGQTLAILMVILVAVVVIALGMYSQIVRNKERVFQERMSMEVGQFTDSIIDSMQAIPSSHFFSAVNGMGSCLNSPEGCCYDDLGDIPAPLSEYLQSDIVTESQDISVCFSRKGDVTSPEALPSEGSFVIPLSPNVGACDYTLTFSGDGAVVVTKVYVKYDEDNEIIAVKDYDYDDVVGILLGSSLTTSGGWRTNPSYSFNNDTLEGYDLYEVRVMPLGGGISYTLAENGLNCTNYLSVMVQVTASESGVSQSSYFELPKNPAVDELFDYVLYNNHGDDVLRYRVD